MNTTPEQDFDDFPEDIPLEKTTEPAPIGKDNAITPTKSPLLLRKGFLLGFFGFLSFALLCLAGITYNLKKTNNALEIQTATSMNSERSTGIPQPKNKMELDGSPSTEETITPPAINFAPINFVDLHKEQAEINVKIAAIKDLMIALSNDVTTIKQSTQTKNTNNKKTEKTTHADKARPKDIKPTNTSSAIVTTEKLPDGNYRIRAIAPNGSNALIENKTSLATTWVSTGDDIPLSGKIVKIDSYKGEVETGQTIIR